jgi:hypothetical protein
MMCPRSADLRARCRAPRGGALRVGGFDGTGGGHQRPGRTRRSSWALGPDPRDPHGTYAAKKGCEVDTIPSWRRSPLGHGSPAPQCRPSVVER